MRHFSSAAGNRSSHTSKANSKIISMLSRASVEPGSLTIAYIVASTSSHLPATGKLLGTWHVCFSPSYEVDISLESVTQNHYVSRAYGLYWTITHKTVERIALVQLLMAAFYNMFRFCPPLSFERFLPCSLKPLDIEFMKHLHDKVNIIPLIAKADTMTPEECTKFKQQVARYVCTVAHASLCEQHLSITKVAAATLPASCCIFSRVLHATSRRFFFIFLRVQYVWNAFGMSTRESVTTCLDCQYFLLQLRNPVVMWSESSYIPSAASCADSRSSPFLSKAI